MRIADEGRIQAIDLPGDWVEREVQHQPLALKRMRSIHNRANANVQMRFIYRGHAESEETGRGFKACLSAPVHALDKEEIKSLSAVIGELAQPEAFQIIGAQTMDLGGRSVLWIEGRWLDSPYWSGSVFIDADGTGCVIQQLECFAELGAYEQASSTFQQILRSIVWKP